MSILFIIYLVAASVQIFFYLLAFYRIQWYRPFEDKLNISDHSVSVVICARNELINLQTLVPKLEKQAHSRFEVIIVDDRSDDGTYEYLKSVQKTLTNLKVVRVDYVPEHVNPKKFALTLGIKAASSDIVLLTDADCEPASIHWIRKMESQFSKNTQFVLGISCYKKLPGLLNLFIRYETLKTALLYVSAAIGNQPYMGVGRNLSYRKSFFLDQKGFMGNLNVVGGDDDLLVNKFASRSNTRVSMDPESLILSLPKTSWKEFFAQKIRHLSVGKRYKFKDKLKLTFFYLSKIVFWLLAPWMIISGSLAILNLGIAVIFMISLWLALYKITRRTGAPFEWIWAVPVDLLFAVYLLTVGPVALFKKRIRWN